MISPLPTLRAITPSVLVLAGLLACAGSGIAAPDLTVREGPDADTTVELDSLGVHQLGSAEGLPQMTVLALAQTTAGYVYAGTQDGLARWDGVRFAPVPIQSGVRAWVNRLWADADGLWVGTDSAGLYWLNDFVLTPVTGPDGQSLGSVEAITGALDGVWVGTPKGLFHCQSQHCSMVPDSADLQVAQLLQTPDGSTLWVGTNVDGLFRFDFDAAGQPQRSDFRLTQASGLPNSAIRGLALDRLGRLWIGTGRGMARWDGQQLTRWRTSEGRPLGGVFAIAPLPDGDMLAALWGGGLARFRMDDGFRWYGLRDGLPDSYLQALLLTGNAEDPIIWLGSGSSGVLRLEPGRWRSFDERQGLPQRVVVGVGQMRFRDGQRGLWAGTLGGAVRQHDGRWQRLLPEPYSDRVVYDAHVDAQGRYWYATSRGVLLDDGRHWREFDADHDRLPATASESLIEFRGRIWAGTGHGLAEISPEGVHRMFLERPEYAEMAVRSMALVDTPERGSLVMIGTGGGALLTDGEHIDAMPADCSPYGSVYDVEPLANGEVWLGTRAGAVRPRWGSKGPECSPVPEPGGAPRSVYEIAQDLKGRVYLFGYDGVRRLEAPDATLAGDETGFRRFDLNDGLPALEFNRDAVVDDAGRLWAANAGGLVVFDPDSGVRTTDPAPLQLRVETGGQRLANGARIPAQHGEIDFAPRLLSFRNEHRIRYRTQLLGLDSQPADWSADGDRRYPRIPPGDYRFEVSALDAAGASHGPLSFNFRVDAPWWQHPLALTGAALGLVLLGLAGGRVRARALAARATELEQLVAIRTEALERASNTDPLTGAWNRRYFHALIGQWLRDSEARGGLLLLLIDIDHFKQINDQYGHAVGDAVLVEVAARLQRLESGSGQLIRWGGEEFLLILSHDPDRASEVRVRAVLNAVGTKAVTVGELRIVVHCSIGFTRCRPPAEGIEQHIDLVIGRADLALYRAKNAGRHRGVEAQESESDEPRWLSVEP